MVCWSLAAPLFAARISKVIGPHKLRVIIDPDDVDYYDKGDRLYIVPEKDSENSAVKGHEAIVIKAKYRRLYLKCVDPCPKKLAKGNYVVLRDKSILNKPIEYEPFFPDSAYAIFLGYPTGAAYQGYEKAKDAYKINDTSGYIVDVRMRFFSPSPLHNNATFYALGIYNAEVKGSNQFTDDNIKIAYTSTGLAVHCLKVLSMT